jgi:hypothetical protein
LNRKKGYYFPHAIKNAEGKERVGWGKKKEEIFYPRSLPLADLKGGQR